MVFLFRWFSSSLLIVHASAYFVSIVEELCLWFVPELVVSYVAWSEMNDKQVFDCITSNRMMFRAVADRTNAFSPERRILVGPATRSFADVLCRKVHSSVIG